MDTLRHALQEDDEGRWITPSPTPFYHTSVARALVSYLAGPIFGQGKARPITGMQHAIAISFAPFPFKVRAIYTDGPKMAKAGIIMAHMPAP